MTASKVYVTPEAPSSFQASGGTIAMTLTSLANNSGWISAQLDLAPGGATSPRARRYLLKVRFKTTSTPGATGATMRIYVVQGDGTDTECPNAGTANATVGAEALLANAAMVSVIELDQTTNAGPFSKTVEIGLSSRYVQIAVWNATGIALSGTAADHYCVLTPVPDESQ